jgi:DNA-binding SARP family transcriptional activator/energy-coupling factor transporter ATP-binding protein EcfA2
MGTGKTPSTSPEDRLDIRLFGHASVSFGGVPVKFAKRSTTLAMLACVLLKRGRPISRESLAYLLFPEVDEAAALAELRRYLYLANKALPPRDGQPWLLLDAETVRWNEHAKAFVDIVEFEQLGGAAETQGRAIDLYAGDLLEDIYDDWVLAERERLRSKYLALLNESIDRHRANREFNLAIAYANRVLSADPWREDTLRTLVAVRYESGDTAGALAEYDRFAKRLRDELAIAPMPETLALRQSIIRNEALPGSLQRAAPPEESVGRSATLVLPFVARQRELAKLRAAWTRAARGAGAFILITGEAGVGKTRLISELARIVQSEGGRVLVGTTAAPESTPYQAILEALRSALPLLLARPPAAARRSILARLLPELRDPGTPDVELPAQSPERETSRTYDALSHAVCSLASPRPLLLVLEDLHWAGPATLEALSAIVKELTRAPTLVLATCRDEETPIDHPLRALQRSLQLFNNVDEIQLERFAENDVEELINRIDGLRDGGTVLARALFAQSEGNAFFLDEAISVNLEKNRALANSSTESVASLIATRLAHLGDDARTVAEIAAVAGVGFTIPLIREVSNLGAASVARGLDELLDRRILREAGARARHDYVFSHHLINESMYDAIEPSLRSQRHLRIARFLETAYRHREDTSVREIARHYERAGDAERSADWYLTAARWAAEVHAYGDAIELATHALDNAISDDVRAASLDVRERARARRGDREGQREDIDALQRLANAPRDRFDVLKRRVLLARSLGESDEEGRLISEMGNLAELLGEDDARAQTLAESATHAGLCSRPSEGLDPARSALAIYERLGDVRGQVECLYLLVDFTSNIGDIQASRAYLARMSKRASSLTDKSVEARALAVAATAHLLRQEYTECFELTKRSLALQVAINDREGEAASRGRLAVTAAWLADYETSLREFDDALRTYESIGNKRGLATTHTNRALLLMRLGLLREALLSTERSNAYFETVQEARTVVANQVNASFITLHLGDAPAAKALAVSALANAREIAFPVFEAAALANLGNAERVLGELDAAIEHMKAGIAIRRPIQEVRDFVDDLADLTLALVSADRVDEALATTRELRDAAESGLGGAFWPHYIWWAISQGLAAAGALAEASATATHARTALQRFADAIADPQTRRTFLSVPINERIAAARMV